MRKISLLVLFSYCHFLHAQENDLPGAQKGYFSFQYDNDFFNATDRYFTQGIRMEFAHPFFSRFPVSHILLGTKGTTLAGVGLEQQCFTPRSIRVDSIYTGERPFAAVMFLSFFKKTMDDTRKKIVEAKIDLGMMGPCAVCEEEQKGLHHALDNIQPLGWEYQLGQEPVLNYSVLYEQGFIAQKHFALAATGQLRAGTLYTDASAGIHTRLGWMPAYASALQRVQPFRLYAFLKGDVKAVGYNATLQGGWWGDNDVYTLPGRSIKRLVGRGTGGVVLAYKRLSLEYTRIFITPEFSGGLSHGWGHCEIRFLF